jgi:hypothetical protein
MYQELVIGVLLSAPDVTTGVRDCFLGAAEVLKATDYEDACPIETVALEVASTNEPLRRATADVFDSWIEAGTTRLTHAGIPEAKARELTIVFLAALEGAFVLCRASKTTEALEVAGAHMATVVQAALP